MQVTTQSAHQPQPPGEAGGRRVVVVGGGVSGLSAAHALLEGRPDLDVVLLDASDRVGGKLRLDDVGGHAVDVGAESVLARRPEAVRLIRSVGLAGALVHPETTAAHVWSRGVLHPMPRGTLMGVPSEPEAARGVLTDEEVQRARSEAPWPEAPAGDVSVGAYVSARLGRAVVDRLVEPLLGGVYAGRAADLSLRATVPALWDAAARGESLLGAAREAAARAQLDERPVFAGVRGGMGTLPQHLADHLRARGATIRTGVIARELHRTPTGWRVVTGPVPDPTEVTADAVVLAVPARPAARLVGAHAPHAAELLGGIEYASMAIVTLAVDRHRVPPLPGSGFLVPSVDGRTIKASTFSAAKWAWVGSLSADVVHLRASVGRVGEEAILQRADEDLVAAAVTDLQEALRGELPVVDAHVQRWGGGLPQYAVGHLDRVASVLADVAGAPGLELAGAAYEGVGIPACIASGEAAAARVLTHLRTLAPATGE